MKKSLLIILILSLFFVLINAETYQELLDKSTQHYHSGKYLESAKASEEAFKIGNPTMLDYYNAACSWGLAGNKKNTLSNLDKAIDAGYLNDSWIQYDKDLKIIHKSDELKKLLEKISKKKEELISNLPESHPETKTIDLPTPKYDSDYSLEKTLKNRRSIRTYKDKAVSLEEVSQILWAAYGVTLYNEGMPEFLRGGLKTAPSAGALYPLDLYIVATNVTGLDKGIYKFKPKGHKLILINNNDVRTKLYETCYQQPMVQEAPFSIVWSAVYSRTTDKYGDRGRERYVCMDLGHSAQNVYLQAVALDLGTCAIGAFDDFQLRLLMNMTKEEEPLYVMPVGKLDN